MFFCGLKSVIFWLDRRHENIDPAGMGFCFIALFFFGVLSGDLLFVVVFVFLIIAKRQL
jgi:hypothetical protein